jgi:hypothetical protein
MEMLDRREEWMCSQVLLNGALTMQSDDPTDAYEFAINYNFTQNITLTGNSMWTNYTTSNPFMDFQVAIDTVSANSVIIPDTAVMNSVTFRWFVASQQVQRTFFAKNIDLGKISVMETQFPGARKVCTLSDPPINIWVYNEWFADPFNSLANVKLIPDYVVLVQLSKEGGNNNRLYCSAVKQMDPETTQFRTYAARRVPRVWADVNDQIRKYELTSKVLPAPVDINNWAVINVNGGSGPYNLGSSSTSG